MVTAYVAVTAITAVANAWAAIADWSRAKFVLANAAEVGVLAAVAGHHLLHPRRCPMRIRGEGRPEEPDVTVWRIRAHRTVARRKSQRVN
jgi:hypothetical protein